MEFSKSYDATLPSSSTRKISMRSRTSLRGFVIVHLPADNYRARKVYFESKLERSFILLMLAVRAVYDLQEQPQKIHYQDQNGKMRNHTFDFVLRTQNGERLAVIVKRAAKADTLEFKEALNYIRGQLHNFGFDKLVLFTDAHTNKFEIINAERLHHLRMLITDDATQSVRSVISQMRAGANTGEILSLAGNPYGGFGAILQAHFDGKLTPMQPTIITLNTPLFKKETN